MWFMTSMGRECIFSLKFRAIVGQFYVKLHTGNFSTSHLKWRYSVTYILCPKVRLPFCPVKQLKDLPLQRMQTFGDDIGLPHSLAR